MPETRVTVTADLARPLAEAWAVVRDFARPWHPWVAGMRAERDARGTSLRRFRVDDQEYLEALSYFSDSDHVLGYRALAGIDGARAYRAELRLAGSGSARAEWSAEIEAVSPRLDRIAAGTRAVFEAGLAALGQAVPPAAPPAPPAPEAPAQMRRETVSGAVRLSCLAAGPASGTTLCLFVHGIGGQATNWEPQLARIGARMPAAALDLRGYGESGAPVGQTTVDDHCADILAVADHFRAEKLVLVGLSFGAWIATSFAMRHADRLAGLVLADGCTGMSEASPAERTAFLAARAAPLDAGRTPADFAPAVVDIVAGPNAGADLRETLRASMAAIPAATYRDALGCFTNPPERLDLSRIPCPVLLMTGEHDALAPPAEIRAVSRRMLAEQAAPDIRFEVIAGAGHLSNLEAPEAFNALLIDLLDRVAPAAPATGKQRRRAAKHARILDAALAEFARNGFSGSSMQAIASRAGVSKPTLYQYFGNKQALLAAVLDVGKSELLAPLQAADGAALVPVLWRYAWTYADFVLRPDMLSLARLIIGEAERLPEVAHDYQQAGPKQALEGTKAFLLAQRARGALAFDDAELAAENLWALILSAPREHALHHPREAPDRARIARHIENGLDVFLAAFSTDPARHRAELARLCALHETGTGHRNGQTA